MNKTRMIVIIGLSLLLATPAWAVEDVVIDTLQTEVSTTKLKAASNEGKIQDLESQLGGLPELKLQLDDEVVKRTMKDVEVDEKLTTEKSTREQEVKLLDDTTRVLDEKLTTEKLTREQEVKLLDDTTKVLDGKVVEEKNLRVLADETLKKEIDTIELTPGPKGDKGDAGVDGAAGLSCWDLNANSICDLASEDVNVDYLCDVLDCLGPAGMQGERGPEGPQGVAGPAGADGAVGPAGPAGMNPELALGICSVAKKLFEQSIISEMPQFCIGTAFVTSKIYYPDALGGLDGADSLCQNFADNAGLSGTYKAWLSTSTESAIGRLSNISTGIYVTTGGQLIANGWDDLTDGTLSFPIVYDENGTFYENRGVWTGTTRSGSASTLFGEDYCADWTSSSYVNTATHGWATTSPYYPPETWTESSSASTCNTPKGFYCFEVLSSQ